jgi:hypothetical protein
MSASGSRDWFQLARIGLEAAIVHDGNLFALLDDAQAAADRRRRARPT